MTRQFHGFIADEEASDDLLSGHRVQHQSITSHKRRDMGDS